MPIEIKFTVYKTVTKPVLMYGNDTWSLWKAEQHLGKRNHILQERTEMGMFRLIIEDNLC